MKKGSSSSEKFILEDFLTRRKPFARWFVSYGTNARRGKRARINLLAEEEL